MQTALVAYRFGHIHRPKATMLPGMEIAVAVLQIRCPACQHTDVMKHGSTAQGTQRYRCQNSRCPHQTFLVTYRHHGRWPEVNQQILEMTLDGSGIRDIARVLHISPTTVIEALKKAPPRQHVNDIALQRMTPSEIRVEIPRVEEAEVDELWSVVGKKTPQRWRWHAIDHHTGVV